MDVLKLTILAFIAAGIVLAISGVGYIKAILISGGVTMIIMLIAIWRTRNKPQDKKSEEPPQGPTIK
jgi:sugar phosphate permease